MQLSYKYLAKPNFFSLMSQSLRQWILWHSGKPSSINKSAIINILINRYLEIGDDTVVCADNDAGGFISMSMIFELHPNAVDDDYILSWRLFLLTTFCTCRSVIVLITFSLLFPMMFSLVGIIVFTQRFCITTSTAIVSPHIYILSYFHPL